mgnify:CR=1 FL=1
MIQIFRWQDWNTDIRGYGDSDWAGDKTTYKSTSGGVILWGGDAIKSWASTQQTIALSSGEAELYALTKANSQSMGILQMLRDFGIEGDAQVYSDSTAAIGIVSRHGLGRTRHIKVQYLWIQEKILNGEVDVKKVEISVI